ncbi:MAG TPA: Rv3235 family protein [Streptosporangiaceae bacterium]|nr:Rv3235 family protein [Streptosporangiaceae bacterium]
MDDSPSDADSQPGLLSPYPFQVPDGEPRPLADPEPDPMAIRLVPVPNWLPPYDDELPGAQSDANRAPQIWATGLYDRPPVVARENDELSAGQSEVADPDGPDPGEGSQEINQAADQKATNQPAEKDRHPEGGAAGDSVGQWPNQFAQVLAETLAGARPASQLTPWTNERARAHIRRLGPLLAVDRRPRVQRVRASQPARDVVEVAVVAEFGSRTRALAARLERADPQPATPGRPGREARWLCTAIESA